MRYARFTRTPVRILVITATLVILSSGCAKREMEAVAARRDIIAYLPLKGRVAVPAAAQAYLLAPYEAPVDRVYVTVGKTVKPGDVIVGMSASGEEVQYETARQTVIAARSDLETARRGYSSELQAARQGLESARSAERAARMEAQQRGVEISDEITVVETTDIDLARAIERRKEAEQAVLDAQARLDASLVPFQQQLILAQQQLQDAQAGLKGAMIRTPIAGTVLEINVQPGQVARPKRDAPVAWIVDLSAVKVYAGVDERHLEQIGDGDPALVTVKELPGIEFHGAVQQIYSKDAGLLRGIEHVAVVDFVNMKGQAKPGMEAQAMVKMGEVHNVLAVPASAVYTTGDKNAVKVQRNGEWHERIVEIGLSDTGYTQIVSGVNEGDVVLANP